MYVDFAMIYRYCVPLQAFWYCGRLMEGLCGRRASVCAISSLCCGSKGKHIERRLNENGVNCSHESQCCFLPKTIAYLSVIYRHIFWKGLHKGDIPDFTGNRLHKILWRTGLYCYVLMYSLPLRQRALSLLQTECFVTVFLFKAVVCLVQILEILLLWCDHVIIINYSEYIFTDKQYFFRYVLI